MSQADRIREFVRANYVEPAKAAGRTRIRIRAGEVDSKMGLGRVPNVNNVLGGRELQEMCGLQLVAKEGPSASTTTTYTYDLVVSGRRTTGVESPVALVSTGSMTSEDREKLAIPETIRRLASLRDDGIITAEEFERKKAELLTRL